MTRSSGARRARLARIAGGVTLIGSAVWTLAAGGCGASGLSDIPKIPEPVIRQWAVAGARIQVVAVDLPAGPLPPELVARARGNTAARYLYAFELEECSDDGLAGLPDAGVPFGLILSRARITAAAGQHMRRWPSLQLLWLETRRLTPQALAALATVPSIRVLAIRSELSAVHLDVLDQFTHLEGLYLDGSVRNRNDLAQLRFPGDLRYLSLARTAADDLTCSIIARLRELQRLWLADTRVTDRGVAALRALRKLRWLDLSRTAITDQATLYLAEMTQLRVLRLAYTRLSNEGARRLSKLEGLKRLDLVGTNVTPEVIRQLKATLADCSIVTDER